MLNGLLRTTMAVVVLGSAVAAPRAAAAVPLIASAQVNADGTSRVRLRGRARYRGPGRRAYPAHREPGADPAAGDRVVGNLSHRDAAHGVTRRHASTGRSNTAVGQSSLGGTTTGSHNVTVGLDAPVGAIP